MKRNSHILMVVGLASCVGLAAWIKSCEQKPVEFDTIGQCKKSMEERGFFCVVLAETTSPALVVSRKPMTRDEAVEYSSTIHSKARLGSMVVMARISTAFIEDNHSIMGKLYALGDAEFMLQILDPKIRNTVQP